MFHGKGDGEVTVIFNETIADQLTLSVSSEDGSNITSTFTDQLSAWSEMHQYFLLGKTPETTGGLQYLSAYRRSGLEDQATIRRYGYNVNYELYTNQVFSLLEALL